MICSLLSYFVSVVAKCHVRRTQSPIYRAPGVLFALCFSFALCSSWSGAVRAEAINKNKITASYVYNFAKNIQWPADDSRRTFSIALHRIDDPELADAFMYLQNNLQVHGKAITVSHVNAVKALDNYHLVFAGDTSTSVVSDIYAVIDSKPVLLVTSSFPDKQFVMVNLLSSDKGAIGFEVNKSNLLNNGLTPLPELILNGGTEIDVANLYREGQASLVALQKQLQAREGALQKLIKKGEEQAARNAELEASLLALGANIEQSNQTIKSQATLLDSQTKDIKMVQQELVQRNIELAQQKEQLATSLEKLADIRQEIGLREAELVNLNKKISSHENKIYQQESEITQLDELVSSQKRALMYLWVMSVLAILLGLTILAAYLVKRRDNLRLAAQSKDLRIARDRLSMAKAKAEDASRVKGEFLSLMSHELRTPLQAIIGYTEVLLEEMKFDGKLSQVNDLRRVLNNSERLLKLINGVLDLAKIESGRMALYLTEVRLSSLVEEAIDNVKPQLEKNANDLVVEVDDGASLPSADPEKLLHILINLLSNAAKFCENGVITLKAIHEPNRIFMSVADTGIGMTPEQQETVFDRFKQADSSITRKYQGSGLGLSITRQFCELMGGTIYVESQMHVGSKFIVNIPIPISPLSEFGARIINYSDINAGMDGELDSVDFRSFAHSILMIDDDPAFLDIMARTMKSEGYHVATATSAEEGLRLAKKLQPKVITLDLLLPDQHGWLLFEEMKKDPLLKDIPIVIISIVDDRNYDKKQQADGYLTKPIGRESLKLVVKKLVPMDELPEKK